MPSLNKVMLIGHLTRDPETRVTPAGTAICQFGLALNREFKDQAGTKREEVTFVDCEAWGKVAEIIGKHCTKGRPLYVEGRLKLDQWDDKTTGQKRSKLKVVAESFQFLGGREQREGECTAAPASTAPRSQPSAPPPSWDGKDEDVPF